jgi:hypothetical protein
MKAPIPSLALAGALTAALAVPAAVRAGEVFAGLATHNLDLGIAVCCYERGADIQFGARTAPFLRLLGGKVRAHAMGSVNTAGGLDYAALGLDVRFPIGAGFYIQPGLGGAIHDGPGEKFQASNDRLYPGSRLLFEPEFSLGWAFSEAWAAELTYTHLSHAKLGGDQNPGMDAVGARIVRRFGK